METTSVTSKGQVTIPLKIRQKLGLCKGSKINFSLVDDHIELRVHENPEPISSSGYGLLKSKCKAVPADFDPAKLLDQS
jgi:AbrB family looped-hinge helix DNA binding protein